MILEPDEIKSPNKKQPTYYIVDPNDNRRRLALVPDERLITIHREWSEEEQRDVETHVPADIGFRRDNKVYAHPLTIARARREGTIQVVTLPSFDTAIKEPPDFGYERPFQWYGLRIQPIRNGFGVI